MLGNIFRESGAGTKQTGIGTAKQEITTSLLVPVPHLMVPVPTCNFCRICAEFQLRCKGTLVFQPPLLDDEGEGYLSQKEGGEE